MVVNAVCPLVKKVHHEVKVRAGKGYTIVYVGHEGHQEAIGTAAVAPDAVHRIESLEELRALPDPDGAGRVPGPDHAGRGRVEGAARSGPGAVAGPVDARYLGPVLRHHQPADGAQEHRRALRRGGGDRIGDLLQHPGAGAHGAGGRVQPGAAESTVQTSYQPT